jgi:membrane-bound lytic murein transglycosylase D
MARTAGVAAAMVVCLGLPAASRAARADFPRPAKLAPAIEFWSRIFATYSEHQVVVHDDWYLGKVYEVIDFRPWYADGEPETAEVAAQRRAKVEETKLRVRAILGRLHDLGPDANPASLSEDERKIAALFTDVSGANKYLAAAERVRSQSGLRERFARGIAEQSRYLDRMESIFRQNGLPVELARLPLVESCFNVEAYSKVGAAGVWQFMPGTGRQYMRVANDIDERRDPIRATHAAVEHLGADYGALGTWPLAITAYNHGRGGLMRATDEVGTNDIGEIATRYRGKAFGFASRNFYAEFLAVLEVTANAEKHFGELPTLPPLDALELEIERPIHLATAARRMGVSTDDLAALNPALLSPVTAGSAMLPRGYVLRVPRAAGESVTQIASALAIAEPQPVRVASSGSRSRRSGTASSSRILVASSRGAKGRSQSVQKVAQKPAAPQVVVHKVAQGQTLTDIARRYGTTVALLQGVNNLTRARSIQAGQRLRIPRGSS